MWLKEGLEGRLGHAVPERWEGGWMKGRGAEGGRGWGCGRRNVCGAGRGEVWVKEGGCRGCRGTLPAELRREVWLAAGPGQGREGCGCS